MALSSHHILSLFGAVAIAMAADVSPSFSRSKPPVLAPDAFPTVGSTDLPRPTGQQGRPGFVVLHFAGGGSGGACRQEEKNSERTRTLFRPYRTPGGDLLGINGHVALRFKASTSEAQIDSVIAAAGFEVFPANRPGCRRYILRVVRPEDDPNTIVRALQGSGLVDYAVLDDAAGRAEGVPGDSFFVDQLALSNSFTKSEVTDDGAPTKYGMGQVLSQYTGPAMRVDRAELSAALFAGNSSMSALDLVKSRGLTTLRVEVPQQTAPPSVRVVLYTLTGTPVRQLVSEALEAGYYLVGWDGNDDSGRRVQPGVYVAVMTAGSFSETRRLVVR